MPQEKDISQYINPLLIESNKIWREILINNPYRYIRTSVFPKVKLFCIKEITDNLGNNLNTKDSIDAFKLQLDKFELRINHIKW